MSDWLLQHSDAAATRCRLPCNPDNLKFQMLDQPNELPLFSLEFTLAGGGTDQPI